MIRILFTSSRNKWGKTILNRHFGVFFLLCCGQCCGSVLVSFGPPGSGSVSTKYGSGSFYHQAEIIRKILIPTVLWLLYDFLCNFKRNKQKTFLKIRIRTKMSRIRNTDCGSKFSHFSGCHTIFGGFLKNFVWYVVNFQLENGSEIWKIARIKIPSPYKRTDQGRKKK